MATNQWILDPTHSEVQFKVKHLMITNVTGSFDVINASVESEDESFKSAKVSFTADLATINTNNRDRDTHLRSADFFDVANNPELTFSSDSFDASSGKISGDLTISGITKPVTLQVEFEGLTKDPWGNQKAGFSISGKINRTDWNLNWNAALETGGVLVSEEVKVAAELQFVKQA